MEERRYLTRAEINRLRAEVPDKWQPLFALLAATGLRISEAVGLRWSDLTLDGPTPHRTSTAPSSKASSSRRSPVTAPARFRFRRPWRAIFRRIVRPTRKTTPTSFCSPTTSARLDIGE
jgi:integrase